MQYFNLKLYILSIITGIATGAVATLFRWLIAESYHLRKYLFSEDRSFWFSILAPVFIWIVFMGVNYMKSRIPYVSGSGIPQSMAAIIGRYKFIRPFRLLGAKFAAGLASIGLGLTLGKEGPSMQMGSVCGTIVGENFKTTPVEKKHLIASGAGAGLAAAFTTPLAPVFFIIENMQGWGAIKIMIPTLLASLCSGYFAGIIFTNSHLHSVIIQEPTYDTSYKIIILFAFAVFIFIVGRIYCFSILRIKTAMRSFRLPRWTKILIVSVITSVMGFIFIDITAGGEKELIFQVHNNQSSFWYVFLIMVLIILTTSIGYGINFSGGLILPTLVLGGISGKVFAMILTDMDIIPVEVIPFFMYIGLALMFTCVFSSPITGLIIAIEITGKYELLVPMIVTVTMAVLFIRHFHSRPLMRSLYMDMISEKFEKGLFYRTSFEVCSNSFYIGKSYSSVKLPHDIEIINVMRYDSKSNGGTYEVGPRTVLKTGDVINVKMAAVGYDQLYFIMSAYCNELGN